MKSFCFVAVLTSIFTSSVWATDIILVNNSVTAYSIVVSNEASVSEKHAAAELASYIKQISGADLSILTEPRELPEKMIVIGDSSALKTTGANIDFLDLGSEGFAIKTAGDDLIIAGGRLRGTMYGVYAFLEEVLGCRWYTPDCSFVPSKRSISVKPLNMVQKPDFEYREPFYMTALDADWAARNKVNGHHIKLDDRRGGKVTYGRFCHTFDEICPVDKYFDTHPEYFSLRDGKRVGGRHKGQLCLTNPDVAKLAIEAVLGWIQENPQATIYSVTQNDNPWNCQCEKCAAVEAEEGSPAGLMLRFVNRVAAEVAKTHPDKLIDTFAYWYTEKAPKITKPLPNVRIRLCPIRACEHHNYETCEKNTEFMQNLRNWGDLTDTLYIWHYNTNFWNYLMPLPDMDQLATSIPMYKRHGVRGIFAQGMEDGGISWMDEMKSYLIAKLLWNSNADPKAIREDFLQGVYGKAGKPVGEFIDILHDKVKKDNIHGSCFDGVDGLYWFLLHDIPVKETRFLSPEIMAKGYKLMDEALEAAESQAIKERVLRARLSLEYVDVMRQVNRAQNGLDTDKQAAISIMKALAEKCKAMGYSYWAAAGGTIDKRVEALTDLITKKAQ